MAVLVVLAGLVLALFAAARFVAVRHMVGIGRAGVAAEVVPLDPDLVPEVVRVAVSDLTAQGLRVAAVSRTNLAGRAPERTAHLVDAANDMVVRVMSVDGHEAAGAGVSAVSWYPGGFLVTSRAASLSVQAREVVQTFPGVGPADVAARHREAIAALAGLGAHPRALPADLLGRLRDDWRADCHTILAAPILTKVRWAARFSKPAKRTTPLADRPDLTAIAASLADPTPAPI